MSTVYAIGETIYDIIFEQGQPKAARVGGSMLNTAVSLGRCGLPVEMITELGADRVGEMVMKFLHENGVSTSFITPVPGFMTPVSLAFLDEQGDAHYSFYKHYPPQRFLNEPSFPRKRESAGESDIVLFGSFYSLDTAIRSRIVSIVKTAKQKGALVIYDPNIRKNHLEEIRKLMPLVEENISLTDIVRGSDEDFTNLFGIDDGESVYEIVKKIGCRFLIITRGRLGADLFAGELRIHVPSLEIKVVSTIGAGDSFNAGIIYGLEKKELNRVELSLIRKKEWLDVLGYGMEFASIVCSSYENYIERNQIKQYL